MTFHHCENALGLQGSQTGSYPLETLLMFESFLRVLSEQPPLTLISGLIRVTGQFTEHSATGLVRVTDAVSVSRVLQEYRVLPVHGAPFTKNVIEFVCC
jgi:hypothetical protein